MSLLCFVDIYIIAFFCITVGLLIGNVKIKKISLGPAGVLFMAVLIGFVISMDCTRNDPYLCSEIKTNLKPFSSIGSSLFVAVVGLSAGYTLECSKGKCFVAFFKGALMSVSAFAVAIVLFFADNEIDASSLLGTVCGALTSTPALSAVCGVDGINTSYAVIGYGATYLFSVFITVFSAQLACGDSNIHSDLPKENNQKTTFKNNGMVQVGIVVVTGSILGELRVPVLNMALGSIGGILLSGILIGKLVRRYFSHLCIEQDIVGVFRTMGLVLFFVGNGIPAGIEICSGGGACRLILYGIVLTGVPIILAFLMCLNNNKKNQVLPSLIAGGMTSTPAWGMLCQKSVCLDGSIYALSYFGSLITSVIIIRFLGVLVA